MHLLEAGGIVHMPVLPALPSLDPSTVLRGDPSAIHLALERINNSLLTDPALAIGSAKDLVESTAKIVLRETGQTFTDREDMADLIRRAQQALALHPT